MIVLSANQQFIRQLVIDYPSRTAAELQDIACLLRPQGGPKVNSGLSYLKVWGLLKCDKNGAEPGKWYNTPGTGFDERLPPIPRAKSVRKPVAPTAVLTFTAQVQFSDGTKVALSEAQFKELKEIIK